MSKSHMDAYFAALNRHFDIDSAYRRELADATGAIEAKWADRKSEAYKELLSAYMKVMPTHGKHAQEGRR